MDHPEMCGVVLTLRTKQTEALPAGLGRAAQSLLLAWIGTVDPGLAQRLHDDAAVKPYTCSTLLGGRPLPGGRLEVRPDRTCTLRLTTLSAGLTARLQELLAHPPAELELDHRPFALEGHRYDAGPTTYQALSAPYLLGQTAPSRYVELEFLSPTTFRSGGRNVPVPLPDLVFGSLVDKWNALSPVAVSPEVRRYAAECMAIAAYDLRSRAWPFKDALVVGGQGRCRYVATTVDRYWLSLVQMLADWAQFSGVGAQTASGLGQARRHETSARPPRAPA